MKGKRVLIRVEYNVPMDSKGRITDDARIKGSIPSLKLILSKKPKQVILMTHLGRPKVGAENKGLTTDVVAKRLAKLLGKKVVKADHCGEGEMPEGGIVMLENLRFYEGEKKGNRKFAKQLAGLADIYVNESFGTCHRKDASMYVVPQLFDVKNRYMGLLVREEISKLGVVVKSKKLTVLIGFAKISDKLEIMKSLLRKADEVIIGGAVAFSFLKSEGLEVGKSLCSDPDVAGELLKKYSQKIILPVDFVGEDKKVRDFDNLTKSFIGLDIGPKSVKLFNSRLVRAKVVFWNGPMGYFEKKPFDKGTNLIAKELSGLNCKVVVGGGDTALAAKKSGYESKFYHISTGGGASLEFIKKGTLPALKWINSRKYLR